MHAAHTIDDDRDPELDMWLDERIAEANAHQDDAALVAACYPQDDDRAA